MPLHVAVLGDSATWGQGLIREHTFAYLAATRLAEDAGKELKLLPGRGSDPLRGESRSGAKIRRVQPAQSYGDADVFLDSFPNLFADDNERRLFLDGSDESPAARLFGEHPANFPTLTEALARYASDSSHTVDLVIMGGGINDANFEDVLDPDGNPLDKILDQLRVVFSSYIDQLLRDARATFPNAIIILTGYFSELSDLSDRDKLGILMEFLSGSSHAAIVYNNVVNSIPLLGMISDLLFEGEDVGDAVRRSIPRSVQAAAHAHFWTRKTVADQPNEIKNPGLIYVSPAFEPKHALFASESMVHDGYHLPGDGIHAVHDEMLSKRIANIPRYALSSRYEGILDAASKPGTLGAAVEGLLVEPDLPSSMRKAASDYLSNPFGDSWTRLKDSIHNEQGRIFVATIASFLHPNELGAKRYAERIISAYRNLNSASLRLASKGMWQDNDPTISVKSVFASRGLNLTNGVRRFLDMSVVQNVAIQLDGVRALSPLPGASSPSLASVTLGASLKFAFGIPAGVHDVFNAFDLVDTSFAEIVTIRILGGDVLRDFEILTIYLNGLKYFTDSKASAKGDLESGLTFSFTH